MKFFATSSFVTLASLCLANLSSYSGSVQATLLPRDGIVPAGINVPADPVPDYLRLMNKCNEGGADAFATFRYESGKEITHKFGQCIPRSLNNEDPAQLVVFCKTAECNIYEKIDCSGDSKLLPVHAPFLGATPVVNPIDVVKLLGAAGRCYPGAF